MFERKTLKQHNTAALEILSCQAFNYKRGGVGGGGWKNDFRAIIFPAIFGLNLGSKPRQAMS